MKKLWIIAASAALFLTGCTAPSSFDGYVHAECAPATQAAAGKVTTCSATEMPVPTETVTQSVPGPTVTVKETVPGPTTTVTVTATPTAAPTQSSTPSPAPTTAEKRYTGYVTGYSYWSNDPPQSANIAYEDVRPGTGASGDGTYANPITVAVKADAGHKPGDKFYLPNLRRYFIVEDMCAVSHSAPDGCTSDFDVWVDGRGYAKSVSDNCMYSSLTGNYTIIKNPAANYRVVVGTISSNCTRYGNTVVTQ